MQKILRAGTRKSLLATTQTRWVVDRIGEASGDIDFETVHVTTVGDRDQNTALSQMPSVGIFTKELDNALLEERIDFAVHSLKDLPTEQHASLTIAAIPARVDPRDALVVFGGGGLADLAPGARVGTSSLRRKAQLLAARDDLAVVELRGNLDTRMKKVAAGEMDAIVVACAGLIRLGRELDIGERIDPQVMLPAVAQGALAVVTRRGDDAVVREAVGRLDDAETRLAVTAERRLLQILGGGCQVPIGALAEVSGGTVCLRTAVVSVDGRRAIRKRVEGPREEIDRLVDETAALLRSDGADEILAEYS